MVKRVNIKPSRFFAEVDGHRTIDTDLKSVNLYPEGYAVVAEINIEFPDLLKTNAYFRWGEGFYSGGRTECRSYVSGLYQEWGPDEPNADDWYFPANPTFPGTPNLVSNYRNLPLQLIGSVPAKTDCIDVRVNLINTVVPSTVLGFLPFSPIRSGEWVHLPGQCCNIEFRDPLARMFDFILIGTSVYLRRFQSVRRAQQMSWLPGNDDTGTSGWTWGYDQTGGVWDQQVNTPPGGAPRADLSRLLYEIEHKGPDVSGNKRRSGSNSCAIGDPTNYRSVWTGAVIIRPGRRT